MCCSSDLMLPDIDGFAVTRHLRGHPNTAGVQVIVLTGFSQNNFQRHAAAAGAARALLKPCLADVMLRDVRRTLGRPPQA